MTERKGPFALVAMMAFVLVTGCSSSTMDMRLSSTANINMNEEGDPLPVVVRVYQLSQAESFRAASFQELWHKDLKTLGNSLLVKKEIVVDPADTQTIHVTKHENVGYIGVIAVFRQTDKGDWKSLKSVSDSWLGGALAGDIDISLKGNSVKIE